MNSILVRHVQVSILALFLLVLIGCKPPSTEFAEKAPRPVSTIILKKYVPPSSYLTSGSVQSWKTEELGFEVTGRVLSVLEPGKNVIGSLTGPEGQVIKTGTPLARIDPSRYKIAVESARAAFEVAELDRDVIQLRIQESLPADIKSAESDVKLARDDFDRIKSLRRQNATSQSEYDASSNRLDTAKARLASLKSTLKQTEAELKAAIARVKSAQQTVDDAERDLKNTTLYGAYRGQISDVQVVPGSVVSAGSPVLTLQMMDPIKVEVQVSAAQSRELQRQRNVPVTYAMPDGTPQSDAAMVYVVDPSADKSTRTFSATLLIKNSQYREPIPPNDDGSIKARTQDIWPLYLNAIIGAETESVFVETESIESDDTGSYLWLVENAQMGERFPHVLTVRKAYVNVLEQKLPFLGNWVFQEVAFVDQEANPGERALIAGKLEFIDQPRSKWDGKSVVVDAGPQWVLRPGDLVSVNLAGADQSPGFFVPVDAIYEESSERFVFVVDGETVQKKQVNVELPSELDQGALVRIIPSSGDEFAEGTQIVLGGVHFLSDGDRVAVIETFSGGE